MQTVIRLRWLNAARLQGRNKQFPVRPIRTTRHKQPFISVARCAVLAAFVIVISAAAPSAQAQANVAAIIALLDDAQQALVQGAYDFRAVGQPAAHADIEQAITDLRNALLDLADPAVQADLGNKVRRVTTLLNGALQKTIKAEVKVDNASPFGDTVAVISNLKSTASGILTALHLVGKPLIAEINPRSPKQFSTSAGFHKPGDVVEFQLDTGGCADATVQVQNGTVFNKSIDVSTVVYDPTTGRVRFVMGQDEGGGRITVSGCGNTKTMLVENYGSSKAQTLPFGFPQNLQLGTYWISAAGSYCIIYTDDQGGCYTTQNSIGPINGGTVKLTSLRPFAKAIVAVGTEVMKTVPNANTTTGGSFASGGADSFTWTISLPFSAGNCSCSDSVTLTVQRQ